MRAHRRERDPPGAMGPLPGGKECPFCSREPHAWGPLWGPRQPSAHMAVPESPWQAGVALRRAARPQRPSALGALCDRPGRLLTSHVGVPRRAPGHDTFPLEDTRTQGQLSRGPERGVPRGAREGHPKPQGGRLACAFQAHGPDNDALGSHEGQVAPSSRRQRGSRATAGPQDPLPRVVCSIGPQRNPIEHDF